MCENRENGIEKRIERAFGSFFDIYAEYTRRVYGAYTVKFEFAIDYMSAVWYFEFKE